MRQLVIGERVRYVRTVICKESQEAFARRLGVSDRTIKRWEASFVAPSREHAEKLAGIAEVPVDLFFPEAVEDESTDKVEKLLLEIRSMFRDWIEEARTVQQLMARNQKAAGELLRKQTGLLEDIAATVEEVRDRRPPRRKADDGLR